MAKLIFIFFSVLIFLHFENVVIHRAIGTVNLNEGPWFSSGTPPPIKLTAMK